MGCRREGGGWVGEGGGKGGGGGGGEGGGEGEGEVTSEKLSGDGHLLYIYI